MINSPNFEPEEAQTSPTGTDGNGSQPPSDATEIPLSELKQSSTPKPGKAEPINQPSIHKSTGPRTLQGKQASKYNALKHGLFSKDVLLKHESRREYNSLLNELRDTLQPQGRLEEVMAENAEISESIHAIGLIWTIADPVVLTRCIELLNKLRCGVQNRGFDRVQDGSLLKIIYGDPEKHHLRQTLQDEYTTWLETAGLAEEVRVHKKSATPEECRLSVLRSIDDETKRLEEYKKNLESIESERTKAEILRQSVPDSRGMDRFLHYEVQLSREFDRTMNQLERSQRMRKGQPVPQTIRLELS